MKRKLVLIILSVLLVACAFGTVFGASADELQSTENIHPGFSYGETGMWGTWEQRGTDVTDGTKLTELVAKTFATDNTAPNEAAIRFSDEVSAYLTDEYDLTFEVQVADNKNAGVIIAGESSNGKPLPYTNSLYVIVKNNEVSLFNGTKNGLQSYSVAAGTWLTVNVFTEIIENVTYYSIIVTNDGQQIAKIDRLNGNTLSFQDDGIRAFVAGEATPASFRNVVIKKGSRNSLSEVYRAFPFADSEIPGAVEYVSGLDPNLTVAYGSSFESESNGKFFRATGLHPDIRMATAYSNFAGCYGQEFTLNFDVKTPTQAVYEKEDDANAGFMFRSASYANPYESGMYVRVEKNFIRVVNSAKAPLEQFVYAVPSDAFGFGDYVSLCIAVKDETLTVSVQNAANQTISMKKTREITEGDNKGKLMSFEELTDVAAEQEVSISGLPEFKSDTQYAGFTASHGTYFKNIVMKNSAGTKSFQLYPVDESRVEEVPETKFVMAKENAADVATIVERGNPKLLKQDEDLFGTIYENTQIFYFTYDGTLKDIKVVNADGSALDEKYSVKLYFNAPPTFSTKEEWKGAIDVNYPQTSESRYGIDGVIVDSDGYIYAQLSCVIRMLPKELTLSGITVKDRAWDGTRWVEAEGGSLSGIIEGDEVGFEIIDAVMEDSEIGNDKPVQLEIELNGADASNYTYVLDSQKTVNITEAGNENQDIGDPGCGGIVATSSIFAGLARVFAGWVLLKRKNSRSKE